MNLLRLILIVALSSVAVLASIHAWRIRQTYGLFRFLAFEFLAILIVWNVDHWFHEAFSIHQIVSWVVFAASMVLAVHGVYLLRAVGNSQARIMENTQTIVEIGAYRYIRHPIYASLMLFTWGVFSKHTDLVSAVLATAVTVFLILTSRYEEHFNIGYFGVVYSEYMKRTKMFIPFLL